MYFPTAGVEVSIWVPPLVAFVISFFTSMGGVSGAFLLLPFQMSFLGYTNPSVSATNQLFNIVAIPSGVYRYCREGRMVWPLTWVVVAGTLPGVFIGAFVRIAYLPDPKAFKFFAGGVLLWIGGKMALELLKKKGDTGKAVAEKQFQERVRHYEKTETEGSIKDQPSLPAVKVTHFNLQRLGYTFYGEQFDVPFWGICGLSLIVGVVGGYTVLAGVPSLPLFCGVFQSAGLHRCRCRSYGNVCHFYRRCWLLSDDGAFLSSHVGGAGLASGHLVWARGDGGHVPGSPLPEVCSGSRHQVDAGGNYSAHGRKIRFWLFREVKETAIRKKRHLWRLFLPKVPGV